MDKLTNEEKSNFIEKMKFNNRISYFLISFNQGIGSISELAVQFYFKDELHLEPARLTQIYSFILIPWTIKPIFGMITDLFPINGYRRKIYIILCGIICILSWLAMTFFVKSLSFAIFFLLLINIFISFSTVLGEAVVVELSQLEKIDSSKEESSASAKDYVSMFFFFKYFGALISSYLKGYLVEALSIKWVFFIASFLPWLIVTSGLLLVEVKLHSFNNNKISDKENEEENGDNHFKNNNKFLICNENPNDLVISNLNNNIYENSEKNNNIKVEKEILKNSNYDLIAKKDNFNIKYNNKDNYNKIPEEENLSQKNLKKGLKITIEDYSVIEDENNKVNKNSNNQNIYHSIFYPKPAPKPTILIKSFINFITQKYVLIPTSFVVILTATPSYADPFFYFLTNHIKFSASLLGKISFCSTLGTLIAIWLYKTFFKNTNFRKIITIGTLFAFCVSFMAFLLVKRINLKIGISDFWFVLLSSSLLSMIGELVLMPMLSLACLLCPKNLEGTVYAMFMSALNFGGIMSGLLGSFLTTWLNITSKNYDNLAHLILIANFLTICPLPFLCLISDEYFETRDDNDNDNDNYNNDINNKGVDKNDIKQEEINFDCDKKNHFVNLQNDFIEQDLAKVHKNDNDKLNIVINKNQNIIVMEKEK
jgi:folate/biopterin transporter